MKIQFVLGEYVVSDKEGFILATFKQQIDADDYCERNGRIL